MLIRYLVLIYGGAYMGINMQNVIVFGSNSTIAKSVINKLALENCNFYFFAREKKQLELQINDLKVKYPGINVSAEVYDALVDGEKILEDKIGKAFEHLGRVDLVFIAHGNLPHQVTCEDSWQDASAALRVNGLSVTEICHNVARRLKSQRNGTIAVISSVAGERGRQSNYIYGTAKGMINVYLQGLRNALYQHNVHVLTIMPGFVDTKMTTEFKKGLLWAKPEKVANDIIKAINARKNVIYTPWFWRLIMKIIKLIPENKFKKMKL